MTVEAQVKALVERYATIQKDWTAKDGIRYCDILDLDMIARDAIALLRATSPGEAQPCAWMRRVRNHRVAPWHFTERKPEVSDAYEVVPLFTHPASPTAELEHVLVLEQTENLRLQKLVDELRLVLSGKTFSEPTAEAQQGQSVAAPTAVGREPDWYAAEWQESPPAAQPTTGWQPCPRPFSLPDDEPFAVKNSNGYCACATLVDEQGEAFYYTAEAEYSLTSDVTHWLRLPAALSRAEETEQEKPE